MSQDDNLYTDEEIDEHFTPKVTIPNDPVAELAARAAASGFGGRAAAAAYTQRHGIEPRIATQFAEIRKGVHERGDGDVIDENSVNWESFATAPPTDRTR